MPSISADELAGLVVEASRGAAPQEQGAADRTAEAIRQAETATDSDSHASRYLRSVMEAQQAFIHPEIFEKFRTVDLFSVDSPYANAIPWIAKGQRRVVVFEGLLHVVHFFVDMIRVMERLQALRTDATLDFGGNPLPEALVFSTAAHSVLSHALANHHLPVLLHDLLGGEAQSHVRNAYNGCSVFILLHELAHIELGHLRLKAVHSERQHLNLAEAEALNRFQVEELEADAYAFDAILSDHRLEFIPSVMMFFGVFAFLEAFSGLSGESHPLSDNRLGALIARADMPARDKDIVTSWLHERIQIWRQLADDRARLGSELRRHIEDHMPYVEAVGIIQEVRKRVQVSIGNLEMSPELEL